MSYKNNENHISTGVATTVLRKSDSNRNLPSVPETVTADSKGRDDAADNRSVSSDGDESVLYRSIGREVFLPECPTGCKAVYLSIRKECVESFLFNHKWNLQYDLAATVYNMIGAEIANCINTGLDINNVEKRYELMSKRFPKKITKTFGELVTNILSRIHFEVNDECGQCQEEDCQDQSLGTSDKSPALESDLRRMKTGMHNASAWNKLDWNRVPDSQSELMEQVRVRRNLAAKDAYKIAKVSKWERECKSLMSSFDYKMRGARVFKFSG